MCQQKGCNFITHFLGICSHKKSRKELSDIKSSIMETRIKTNKELREFNKQLNLIIKDENIRVTLTNIKKVSK